MYFAFLIQRRHRSIREEILVVDISLLARRLLSIYSRGDGRYHFIREEVGIIDLFARRWSPSIYSQGESRYRSIREEMVVIGLRICAKRWPLSAYITRTASLSAYSRGEGRYRSIRQERAAIGLFPRTGSLSTVRGERVTIGVFATGNWRGQGRCQSSREEKAVIGLFVRNESAAV